VLPGRKAFMLQTLAPRPEERGAEAVAQADGFSLHAGVAAQWQLSRKSVASLLRNRCISSAQALHLPAKMPFTRV
jgi:hypothetical protein